MFEFVTAGRIVVGSGTRSRLGDLTLPLGRRALVGTGSNSDRHRELVDLLTDAGIEVTTATQSGEPTAESVTDIVAATPSSVDVVVAIGGGSVIDAAKAAAALLTNGGEILDYVEVVGAGRTLEAAPLPMVAVPTSAGTGAEVTKNAVVTVPEHHVKVSLRHDAMVPAVALVDPELTLGLPPHVTAHTGFDALTQCIESFVSGFANPVTDGLARTGIALAAGGLERAWSDGSDLAAREAMSTAALLGGMALANAKLGAVHGLAGPMGGVTGAPHGSICGHLLAPVMAANLASLDADHPAVGRHVEVARLLTGRSDATAEDGVAWVTGLAERLGLDGLDGPPPSDDTVTALVEAAQRSSSMRGNPVTLGDEVVTELIRGCWR